MNENLSSMEPNNSNVGPSENGVKTAELFWKLMNPIRGNDVNDYQVIFFFLTLRQLGYLDKLNGVKAEDLVAHLGKSIAALDRSEAQPDLSGLFDFYRPILERIDPAGLRSLLFALNNEVFLNEISFEDLFEDMLGQYLIFQSRFGDDFSLPTGIANVIAAMLELPENARVYNPFGGIASFPLALKNVAYCLGQELSPQNWAIGYMRIIAHGLHQQIEWQHAHSIQSWAGGTYDEDALIDLVNPTKFEKVHLQQFDLVIAAPPRGMRFILPASPSVGPTKTLECVLLENAIRSLKPGGQVAAILAPSFLTKMGHEYHLRQYLMDNNLIDAIIQFPVGLMHRSSTSFVALFLKTDRESGEAIKMIDASGFFTNETKQSKLFDATGFLHALFSGERRDMVRHFGVYEIDREELNLSVRRFFVDTISDVRLGDLGSLLRSGRSTEGATGKLVRIRHLKDQLPDFRLNDVGITDAEIPKSATRIAESCILLPARWQSFKPVWFEYTGTPIYIMPDMLAFIPDKGKCDPLFLITELQEDYIDKQVQQLAIGQVIPTLRSKDVLSIQIKLPSPEEQAALLADRRKAFMKEKERELALFREIHGLEMDLQEQNSFLRHKLAGPSSNLKSAVTNLTKLVEEILFIEYPNSRHLKLSERHKHSLADYLEMISRDAEKIATAVERQIRPMEDIFSRKLVPIDIIAFLKQYVSEYQERTNIDFEVRLNLDSIDVNNGEKLIPLFIDGDEDLLRAVLDNLVENAVQHAFPGYSGNFIEFLVPFDFGNASLGTEEVKIFVMNSGAPFPEGYTTADLGRKGFSSGKNGGDGIGGWYIVEAMKKMNGRVFLNQDMSNNGYYTFTTIVELAFPLNFEDVTYEEV